MQKSGIMKFLRNFSCFFFRELLFSVDQSRPAVIAFNFTTSNETTQYHAQLDTSLQQWVLQTFPPKLTVTGPFCKTFLCRTKSKIFDCDFIVFGWSWTIKSSSQFDFAFLWINYSEYAKRSNWFMVIRGTYRRYL